MDRFVPNSMYFFKSHTPRVARIVFSLALPLTLGACGTTGYDRETGLYAEPARSAPATENPSIYTNALTCLAVTARNAQVTSPRIAVGRIGDLTGKNDLLTGSKVGQGASLFALTALGKAGFRVVERYDTTVSDIELQYARDHVLSDTPDAAGMDPQNYRPIYAGQIAGSDYYIVGGVTELNDNLSSSGVDLAGGGISTGALKGNFQNRNYVINIAIDLRLINTRTQEVTDMASYQKQLVGHEIKAGVFQFFGSTLVDLSGGKSSMEPMQLAVRSLIDRAVFEFGETLYGVDAQNCLEPGAARRALKARPVRTAKLTPVPVSASQPPARRIDAHGYEY